ncbi:metal-dependent hydrolase, partial [Halobium palmae]
MMPWGHFLVAFVPFAAYRVARGRRPDADSVFLLLVATQFPDLVDKPLAWTLGVFPSGRLLAHSVVFAVPLVLIVSAAAWHRSRPDLGALFTFGYLSHLYTDSLGLLRQGAEYYFLPNLFFPLVAPNPDHRTTFVAQFAEVEPTPTVLLAVAAILLAGLYVAADLSRTTL